MGEKCDLSMVHPRKVQRMNREGALRITIGVSDGFVQANLVILLIFDNYSTMLREKRRSPKKYSNGG